MPTIAGRMTLKPTDIVTATKPLIFLIDAPTADVSASAIRAKRAAGESIAGLVPPVVQQYIEQQGLYGPKGQRRRASDASASASAGRLHGKD